WRRQRRRLSSALLLAALGGNEIPVGRFPSPTGRGVEGGGGGGTRRVPPPAERTQGTPVPRARERSGRARGPGNYEPDGAERQRGIRFRREK
ncbi:unnamed protein product, partial [Ixodes pacificus]